MKKTSFSSSKIDLWKQCELKFYAHVLLGIRPKNNFSRDPKVQLGSILHKFFHEFYKDQSQTNLFKQNIKSLRNLEEEFCTAWDDISKSLDYGNDTDAKTQQFFYQEKGLKALKNFYKREEKRGFKQPVFLEKWFKLSFDEFSLTGRVDRIDREEDGSISIVDYKITDKILSVEDAKGDNQLTIYSIACLQSLLNEKAQKLILYYPTQDEEIISYRNDSSIEELLLKLKQINSHIEQHGLQQDKYNTNPADWKCSSCGFQKQCPEFNERKKLTPGQTSDLKEKIDRHKELQNLINFLNTESNQLESEIITSMKQNKITKFENYKLTQSENTSQ
ncbi:MAG: PD-(D/E)XK nuclease family protein [Candidatus Caenarcaniphilales bacterium]|nr:PD-(D/E)XK nuclease family protein [Candidatus Caenarcaniphilales bacterium]